jgi:hypothetical protein
LAYNGSRRRPASLNPAMLSSSPRTMATGSDMVGAFTGDAAAGVDVVVGLALPGANVFVGVPLGPEVGVEVGVLVGPPGVAVLLAVGVGVDATGVAVFDAVGVGVDATGVEVFDAVAVGVA